MLAAHVAAWLALVWASVLAWLAIGAVLRRHQLDRRFKGVRCEIAGSRAGETAGGPSVLIMRPCAGQDPALLDNLRSLAHTHSTLPLHVVMAVDDPADTALPAIEQAAADLRATGLSTSVEVIANRGPNRKASILAGILARHPAHALAVNVDSNVDLAGFDFDPLLAPLLHDASLGTMWVPWSERPLAGGLGTRASDALLGGSLTAFPLLCGIYPQGLVGKFWAARREVLERIAFAELVDFLGEDLEMARRLRALGLRVGAASLLVRSPARQPSFAAAVERFARWMLVVRAQKLGLLFSYPAFFFATPMVLALAALGALARPSLALAAAGMAVLARLTVALAARRWSGRGLALGPAIVDAVLADLVLGLAWLRAGSSREVEWRGHRLRIESDGRLRALEREIR